MNFLWSLFALRHTHRHFVYLDASGMCQVFRHCATPPKTAGWVEVYEVCPSWLNHPLPDNARAAKPETHFSRHPAMAN
ncbi:hypothetical protein QN386_21750 [Pseudomonas sp. CCI3.2]|uniref:hypothetical protein n=1 Tax=unclassified Pseudomonas TaxID=196821 RepID=UPI002AC9D1C0|nr:MULTISPECIES: hypothetical protein [unclassified Pseudomonas]MEB0080083.1 hypothetical protein [Pseudomonas sp. MH10out]MEB0094047.1 hypothetical protein [Pseudomonas sp. CCI4.2]MEB0103931.1 hypothetical protein [Pseudomonas sp. CCI3.2]MEB0133175.1 hypothetical protein [Pseudomonas sp. CCI2.4]MEB0160333.1 hypothetical protein [Pseudomonas sp. AH2 (2023)]